MARPYPPQFRRQALANYERRTLLHVAVKTAA